MKETMSVDEVPTNRQSVAVVVADEVASTVLRVDEDSLVYLTYTNI